GLLEQPTLDLILGPFLRPGAATAAPEDSAGATPADPKLQASLKYFQAVEKKLRDTRAAKGNTSFPKLANSFTTAARQIDDLPMLNVDDELLDWGASVSTTLRSMALTAQAAGGQIDLLEYNKAMVQVTTPNYYYGSSYGVYGGPWGGAGYGYN